MLPLKEIDISFFKKNVRDKAFKKNLLKSAFKKFEGISFA